MMLSKAAREVAVIALVLGAAGDGLLRVTPWGINAGCWVMLLVCALAFLARRNAVALTRGGIWMLLVMVAFAGMLAWRDSPVLVCLNVAAVLTALTLAALRGRVGELTISEVMEYPIRAVLVGVSVVFGAIPLVRRDMVAPVYGPPAPLGGLRHIAISRGLVLTTPLVLVFGGLLMGADPIFSHDVNALFDWNIDSAVRHFGWILFWSALGAGMLRTLLIRPWPETSPAKSRREILGFTETAMILGALNVLFLAFVIVQFQYFFGGQQFVQKTIGMAYAQYARSGFFQLVWVTLLVLPLLLALHGLLKTTDLQERRWFHRLSAALVLLLFIIMASAVQRMLLYTQVYGVTELRLYTTAFMGWLGLVFVWFMGTVLRERSNRFTFGAIVAGFVVIACLNVLDPNGMIVRVNLQRAFQGGSFDADYNADALGADAVPSLVAALPRLRPDLQQRVAVGLLDEHQDLTVGDWRNWNWSRSMSRNALRNRAALEKIAGCSVETKGATQPPCPEQDDD